MDEERPRHMLREELSVRKLVTFYYRELTRHFYTSGERHDFWEFVYVDKGEVGVFTDTGRFVLEQGDMIFYKPNLFHGGQALNGTAPNLVIVSFECESSCMRFFEDRCIRLQTEERQLLSRLVQEGMGAFDPPIDSPNLAGFPSSREGADFGGEQLIRNYLEILLIQLIRRERKSQKNAAPASISGERENHEAVSVIVRHLHRNLARNYTFDELCEEFAISRTRLKTLFRENCGVGVMEYFNRLKIEQAKRIIREESASFSETAERLGYSSVHYFSKQFKRITDMSPSEYVRTINARAIKMRGRDGTAAMPPAGLEFGDESDRVSSIKRYSYEATPR